MLPLYPAQYILLPFIGFQKGATALMYAAKNGHRDCINALIIARAKLDAKDEV